MQFSKFSSISITFVLSCVINGLALNDPSNNHDQNDDTAIIKIPHRVYVILKRPYDDQAGFMYVDQVYEPSYRQVEMRASDYLQLECGAMGFDVIVHHCDCKEYCTRRLNRKPPLRPTSFDLNYRLSYHMINNNNSTYFSAAADKVLVWNKLGLIRASGELLIDRRDGDEHFGPFRKPELAYDTRTAGNATEARRTATLFREKAFKKWIIHEVTGNMMTFKTLMEQEKNSSDVESFATKLRQLRQPDDQPSAELDSDDNVTSVTLHGAATMVNVSLGRFECVDLDDSGNFSFPATVDKGSCVITYGGHGCTGANYVVVRKHVNLHTEDREPRRPLPQAAAYAKSVSTCCRNTVNKGVPPYVLDNGGGPSPEYYLLRHSKCSCSCSVVTTNAAAAAAAAAEEPWTRPTQTDKPINRPRWSELIAGFNATGTFAARLADEAAIAAVIAETPADRVAAASNAAIATSTAAEIGTRMAELMANGLATEFPEHGGSDLVASVKELAEAAAGVAARAATATPDTASLYAADAARMASQLQRAISFVCESWPDDMDSTTATATTTKTAETRKRRRLGEWRTVIGGLRTRRIQEEESDGTGKDRRPDGSINRRLIQRDYVQTP